MNTNVRPSKNHPLKSPAEEHRAQMIWQVWVPLGSGILIFLVLAGLSVAGAVVQSPQIERWGNLSAVWVFLPVLLTGLIVFVIVGACVYGMSRLLQKMPEWMLKLQLLMVRFSLMVRRASNASTSPVFMVQGFNARTNSFWQQIFGKKYQSGRNQ